MQLVLSILFCFQSPSLPSPTPPLSRIFRRNPLNANKRQATIASLAAERAAAQSRAAKLEASLARVSSDHRRRAEKSRQANAIAADRLSTAESRAQAAEARVETVVRHLTFSERRLREAERRAAAESAKRKAKESDDAASSAEAAASARGGGVRTDDAAGSRQKKPARRSVEDAAFARHKEEAAGYSNRYVHGNEGESYDSEGRRHRRTSRTSVDEEKNTTSHASNFADGERQQHGDTVPLQENRDPAGSLTVAFGFPTSSDNEDTAGILREVEAARQQVAVAEREAVAFRVDANRVKVEAAKMAAEAEIGKERAMMESERLARELKATGLEVCHAGGVGM